MAPEARGLLSYLTIASLLIALIDGACKTPTHFQGDWFSIEQGNERDTLINEDRTTNPTFDGGCEEMIVREETRDSEGRYDAFMLFNDESSGCFKCFEMYYRTPNIIQFKVSSCRSSVGGRAPAIMDVCSDILPQSELFTLFRKALETVNCKNTFEGVYHFTYEVDFGGGGICDSPYSNIVACQEPGSPYVDNQVFNMEFGKCPEVSSSVKSKIRFQCMGEWRDATGNVWSAMANLGEDVHRDKFRCMMTRDDQQRDDNKRRFTMSRWAQCDTLRSPYDGDIRLLMWPVLAGNQMENFFVYGNQLVEPSCRLPRNFTGSWFTTGEFDTEVYINATHIYFKTKIDEYTYKETYFTCQQAIDSRFLMTSVIVGKCEVDYVCFDFAPRHHNIIRWRMSKPYRLTTEDMKQPDFLIRKFRQACSWTSFTIDREETDWKYNIFILNPPAPVDCPIAGRYKFSQRGTEAEKYRTRVEGITVRPRHQIDCRKYTSEFKSCAENTKKIEIDIEYCDTVDHTGRPIGEYDIPDNELSCVGFWMEDMKSYMITYDEEDAVSPFRCWVYERLDWRYLRVSRSTRALCSKLQTSLSYTPEEGASLSMELHESERIFDDCPQRFNIGEDPYSTELAIYVLGGATSTATSAILLIVSVLFTLHASSS